MSQNDTFIDEVSEELRRERLFRLFRRWGPWVLAALILIVAASAWNEWTKAQERAAREAAGDALRAALTIEEPSARIEALRALDGPDWPADLPLSLALAGAQAEAAEAEAAEATLRLVIDDPAIDAIYRDAARLKLLTLRRDMAPADRRALLDPMVGPDAPFRLLALEQRAVAWIEEAEDGRAREDLQAILDDPLATGDLRFRADQLLTAIGGANAETD